jgi:ABC-type transport system involved in multi-copper enzyme maturation permease subunit
MIDTLRSELRKLLTVRSTYIATALAIALTIFFAFYVTGYKADKSDIVQADFLSGQVTGAITTVTIIGALIAILVMTHEYRYNTIMYSLTAANRRTKVLLSKVLVVAGFAVVFTALIGVISPIAGYLGVHASGRELAPQIIHYGPLIWQTLFYGVGIMLAALLIAVLVRSQVGAIAALFVIPGALEGILSALLKQNAVYLPFTALGEVTNSTAMGGGNISPGKGALVFLVYMAVGWAIAAILFVRRDAN